MHDHHCLYQHGWMISAWCDLCSFDWTGFKWLHSGLAQLAARAAYEKQVEADCDEPLQLGPPVQLVLPWDEQEPSAEEIAAALRRQAAGCAWSLDQLSEPQPN